MESRVIPRSAPPSTTSTPSMTSNRVKSPPSSAKPKKWDTVFSYLTFREPSVQAMKQYEKELKRKNGRKSATPTGMTMSSAQKLPKDLPKVNSKWSGVPDQATRQRAKRLVPPSSASQPSLRSDPYQDEVESINSRYTGSSSQGRGGSSLWSASHRDTRTETSSPSARASTASLTNSVQVSSSGVSYGSLMKSDLITSSLQRHPGGDSIYASSIGSRPSRQFGRVPQSPIHSDSASISTTTTYTTPMTPPPVPPEYLESVAGQVYPNPVYCPKNSDGSLMHDSHERHEQHLTMLPQLQTSVHSPAPDPPPPRDPLAPHPFRKLRGPRPVEAGTESTPSILKKSSDEATAGWEHPPDTSGRKPRPKLTLRPESLFGKKPDPPATLQSAPPDGRRGFMRRTSFRD